MELEICVLPDFNCHISNISLLSMILAFSHILIYCMTVPLKTTHFISNFLKIKNGFYTKIKENHKLNHEKIDKLDFTELSLINYTMHHFARASITK